MILTALLIVVISAASFARKLVAEGKTFSALGDYRIEVMDEPVVLNGKELEAFIISYQNTDMKVTVAVEKHVNAKTIMCYLTTCQLSTYATKIILELKDSAKILRKRGIRPLMMGLIMKSISIRE